MYKWGHNAYKCLGMRQNGYDNAYHQMKRPQDFEEDEEQTLTLQGVPDRFETPEESSSREDKEDYGHWTVEATN